MVLDKPKKLRGDLRRSDTGDLRRRRGIVAVSLAGMGSMSAVTLLQTGIVRHLPDPPLPGMQSDQVNLSDDAYRFGAPDGTLSLASLALNLPLAAFGGADRARRWPWLPLVAAGKAALDAAAAAWYFRLMPVKEKAWCAYCIAGAISNFAILLLALPEAKRGLPLLRKGQGRKVRADLRSLWSR